MNTITLTKHRKSRQITKKDPSSVSDQMAVWNCRVTRHCMQVSSEESGRIWRFSLSPVMAHLLQQSALEWSGSERCARTVRTFRCQYHSLWGRSLWLFYCPWWHHIRCRKSTLVVTFHPRFPVPVFIRGYFCLNQTVLRCLDFHKNLHFSWFFSKKPGLKI